MFYGKFVIIIFVFIHGRQCFRRYRFTVAGYNYAGFVGAGADGFTPFACHNVRFGVAVRICGFSLWLDFIAFFLFYIFIFGTYTLLLRRWLPLPHTEIEQLLKLAKLKEDGLLSEDEYKAAKKRLLKI